MKVIAEYDENADQRHYKIQNAKLRSEVGKLRKYLAQFTDLKNLSNLSHSLALHSKSKTSFKHKNAKSSNSINRTRHDQSKLSSTKVYNSASVTSFASKDISSIRSVCSSFDSYDTLLTSDQTESLVRIFNSFSCFFYLFYRFFTGFLMNLSYQIKGFNWNFYWIILRPFTIACWIQPWIHVSNRFGILQFNRSFGKQFERFRTEFLWIEPQQIQLHRGIIIIIIPEFTQYSRGKWGVTCRELRRNNGWHNHQWRSRCIAQY